MRTMAGVWSLVIVFIAIQEVYGQTCDKMDFPKFNCDECIRCGGTWCNEQGSDHCSTQSDDWCPNHQEPLVQIGQESRPGAQVTPIYDTRTLSIDVPDLIDIHHTSKTKQKPKISIVNSTQTDNIDVKVNSIKCTGTNCTTTIYVKPTQFFCSATGGTKEYVTVNVEGLDESVVMKFHVPCACECSRYVEKNSKHCNGNGDYSCGLCTCQSEWTGVDCSKLNCLGEGRGDIIGGCKNPLKDNVNCSGNGYCTPCDNCICYTDREGSQYFDKQNYCSDICLTMNDYDACFANSSIGVCFNDFDNKVAYMNKYNSSLLSERDELNRTVWIKCNITVNDCQYNYVAKRDMEGYINVMVVESCNDMILAGQIAAPQVPIILGIVGLLAVVAAAGGFMIWKHMTALPPPPLNNPGYQNIDAEDCTGENPLYKPPTTNFQNPTYGKW